MPEKELFQLSDNLKEYIIEDHMKDVYEAEHINLYKYRTLRITIDPSGMYNYPNFKVQIGILEAYFEIEDGVKLSGSLGTTDENIIRKWLDFGSNKSLLMIYWLGETTHNTSKVTPFDLD